jgi:hypothetical protein
MSRLLRRATVLATLLLYGCVAYSPVFDAASAHKPGMAYLAGVFMDETAQSARFRSLGIAYEHIETGTTHTFEFQKEGKSDLLVIEVPPGTYRVHSWFMTGLGNEVMVRGKPQGALFTRQFKAAADEAHFLGQYAGSGSATSSGTMVYYNARMRPLRIMPRPADQKAFETRYPNIGKLPLKAAYL